MNTIVQNLLPATCQQLIAFFGCQTEFCRDLFLDFRHPRLTLRGAIQNREHKGLVIRNGHSFDP
jgi:hypothetical protein